MELCCSAKVRYLVPFITESTLTGAVREQGAEGHILTCERGERRVWGSLLVGSFMVLLFTKPYYVGKEWETDGRGALWGETRNIYRFWYKILKGRAQFEGTRMRKDNIEVGLKVI